MLRPFAVNSKANSSVVRWVLSPIGAVILAALSVVAAFAVSIPNGDFSADTTGWTPCSGATLTWTASGYVGGGGLISDADYMCAYVNPVDVVAGVDYRLTWWARSDLPGMGYDIQWIGDAGLQQECTGNYSADWTQYTCDGQFSSSVWYVVQFVAYPWQQSDLTIDQVQLEAVPTATPTTTATPTPTETPTATGVSTSTPTPQPSQTPAAPGCAGVAAWQECFVLSSGETFMFERTWSTGELFIFLALLGIAAVLLLRWAADHRRGAGL